MNGIVTGAADDDCCAIGTYASAGAQFGTAFLWIAPLALPMMYTVVYLSSKLGQVTGKGLFAVLRERIPLPIVYACLALSVVANVIAAAADLAAMAAATAMLLPLPQLPVVAATGLGILALQILGSYRTIHRVFRWLALALLAYVLSAVLVRPDWTQVLRATLTPNIPWDPDFLSLLVAAAGTSVSAYLYSWQSSQEVEQEIAQGRYCLSQRQGATDEELRESRRSVLSGMTFATLIIYAVLISTAFTLHRAGQYTVDSPAHAAQSLRPLAGPFAQLLFAVGLIGVGFLAVPVLTVGAAYNVTQTFGWRHSLHAKPRDAKRFYFLIATFTVAAIALNLTGINPMQALVWAGVVQGLATLPLLILLVLLTNSRHVMGEHRNSRATRALAWSTLSAVFLAVAAFVVNRFHPTLQNFLATL